MKSTNQPQAKKSRRTVIKLVIIVLLMFGFGFAMVPFYDLFCQITGINGKTNAEALVAAEDNTIDKSRLITVQFVATNNAELPWEFKPNLFTIKVHPGAMTKTSYFAENLTDKTMTVQAIPSVTPGLAAKYLKKTECFCFTQQTLAGGAKMDMPLLFHIDPSLPKDITTITLSYTLFDASKYAPRKETGKITS